MHARLSNHINMSQFSGNITVQPRRPLPLLLAPARLLLPRVQGLRTILIVPLERDLLEQHRKSARQLVQWNDRVPILPPILGFVRREVLYLRVPQDMRLVDDAFSPDRALLERHPNVCRTKRSWEVVVDQQECQSLLVWWQVLAVLRYHAEALVA